MGLFTKKRTGVNHGGYAPATGPATYDIVGDVKWKKAKDGKFYPTFKNVHGVLNPAQGAAPMQMAPAPMAFAPQAFAAPCATPATYNCASACGPAQGACSYAAGAYTNGGCYGY